VYPSVRTVKARFAGRLPSRQTTVTLLLVLGLAIAFAYAVELSYFGATDITNAFTYQSTVVAAQRDSELLQAEQFDREASAALLRPFQTLLANDLGRIETFAETQAERPPPFKFPATRASYEELSAQLEERSQLGRDRFAATVAANTHSRDLSNAMFAFVALLFAVVVGRLRRTIEQGQSLVERLQRAFISRKREIRNIDLGSVLLSATRGSNVGGDTHDAFTLDNRHAMFMVADVSGKGIEAAVDTALIKYTIRTLFSLDPDPASILTRFARMYEASAENASETFVVLFLALVNLDDGTVRYASAGHEPAWAIIGQDVTTLPPTGSIVNSELTANFETHELHLRPGDALVVTTDGLTESRDARGQQLGASGVVVWLSELGGSAQAMADAIVRRLRKRSSRIGDDLAILVVRFNPRDRPGAVPPRAQTAIGAGTRG
jgi:serine phosphatase RsbU (regulator of sigma subunit)